MDPGNNPVSLAGPDSVRHLPKATSLYVAELVFEHTDLCDSRAPWKVDKFYQILSSPGKVKTEQRL